MKQEQQKYICNEDRNGTLSEQHHSWCNFEVVDQSSLIVQTAYLTCVIVFFFFAFFNFLKIKKYGRSYHHRVQFGQGFKIMYRVFFAWIVSILIRTMFNILVYCILIYPNQDDQSTSDAQMNQPIVILSNISLVLRFVSAFLVNLIIFIYPYQWLKAILKCANDVSLRTFQSKRQLKLWMGSLNAVRIYCLYLRNLDLVFILSQPILFYVTDVLRCSMRFVDIYFFCFQSLLATIFYIYCYLVIRGIRRYNLLKYQSKQAFKLQCKFTFIVVFFSLRIIANFLFQFVYQTIYSFNRYCSSMNQQGDDSRLAIIFAVKHILTHLLPVLFILVVYRPRIIQQVTSQITIQQQRHLNIQRQFFAMSLTQKPILVGSSFFINDQQAP